MDGIFFEAVFLLFLGTGVIVEISCKDDFKKIAQYTASLSAAVFLSAAALSLARVLIHPSQAVVAALLTGFVFSKIFSSVSGIEFKSFVFNTAAAGTAALALREGFNESLILSFYSAAGFALSGLLAAASYRRVKNYLPDYLKGPAAVLAVLGVFVLVIESLFWK